MRFGLFIPQGWRHDLVGIDPAEQWPTMRGVARRADARAVGVDLGLRPLPHRAGAERGGHARGVDPHGGLRRGDRAGSGSARCAPAWATATRRTWRRWPPRSTSSPAGGWRWASAPAGTSTSGGPTATASRRAGERLAMLDEGVEIMHQAWTERRRDARRRALPGRRRLCRPLPLQDGGIPLWIAGGGEKKTLRIAARVRRVHQLRRHARGVPAQVARSSSSTAGTSAATSTRSPGRPTTTSSSARPRRSVEDRLRGVEDRLRPYSSGEELARGSVQQFRTARWSARPSRSWSGCGAARRPA